MLTTATIQLYQQKALHQLEKRIDVLETHLDDATMLVTYLPHIFAGVRFCDQTSETFLCLRLRLIDTLRTIPLRYAFSTQWQALVEAAGQALPPEKAQDPHTLALLNSLQAKFAYDKSDGVKARYLGHLAFDYALQGTDIDLITESAQLLYRVYVYQHANHQATALAILSRTQARLLELNAPVAKQLCIRASEADVFRRMGEVIEGYRMMEMVVQVSDLVELSTHEKAVLYLDRGIMRQAVGDYMGAMEDLSQSATFYEQNGEFATASGAWGDLGLALWGAGELPLGEQVYLHALELARQSGDTQREMKINGNLGLLYLSMGKLGIAKTHIEIHANMAKSLNAERETLRARGNLGMVLLYMKQTSLAISEMLHNIKTYTTPNEGRANSLITLALCYHRMGASQSAHDCLQEALAICADKHGTPLYAIAQRARAELSPDIAEATACLQEALHIAQKLERKVDIAGCLLKLAQLDGFSSYYDRALAILEEIDAMAWLKTDHYPLLPLVV